MSRQSVRRFLCHAPWHMGHLNANLLTKASGFGHYTLEASRWKRRQGRGREEQLKLSLGKQIGIIYNLSDVNATTKTMLQKEAAKTFKQLNAHTHTHRGCICERERERHSHMVKNEAQSSHRNAWKITWKCQRIKSRNRFTKYKQLACPVARRRSQRESDKVSKERETGR